MAINVKARFDAGEYPVLDFTVTTTPRIARLLASSDYRKNKRGLRLLHESEQTAPN